MLVCSLKDRVYRSNVSIATTHVSSSLARSGTYKSWSEDQMERALTSVVSEGLSVRRAACLFNVPKSSLGDRVSGRVMPGSSSGPPRYLTAAEENELVLFLTRSAAIGFGKSRKHRSLYKMCCTIRG